MRVRLARLVHQPLLVRAHVPPSAASLSCGIPNSASTSGRKRTSPPVCRVPEDLTLARLQRTTLPGDLELQPALSLVERELARRAPEAKDVPGERGSAIRQMELGAHPRPRYRTPGSPWELLELRLRLDVEDIPELARRPLER